MDDLGGLRDDGNGDWRGLLGMGASNRFLEIFQCSWAFADCDDGADRVRAQVAVPAAGQPLLGGVGRSHSLRRPAIDAPSVKQTASEIVGFRRDQRPASRVTTTTNLL
jgi:hypothetical protein